MWDSKSKGGADLSFLIQASIENTEKWSNLTLIKESDKQHILSEGHYITNVVGLPQGIYQCQIIAFNSLGTAEPVLLSRHVEIIKIIPGMHIYALILSIN